MQRDIDLLRQLLFEIERRGATSPIDRLRLDSRRDADERIRYHLRQLTDAGFLKEAGQSSAGTPCVRLTHAGQEFIELARSEVRWRKAKAAILASTGGVPLTLLKTLLAKWAWRSVVQNSRRRTIHLGHRADRYVERIEPEVWLDAYATDPDALWDDDQARLVREQAALRRGQAIPPGWDADLYDNFAEDSAIEAAAVPLPEHLI